VAVLMEPVLDQFQKSRCWYREMHRRRRHRGTAGWYDTSRWYDELTTPSKKLKVMIAIELEVAAQKLKRRLRYWLVRTVRVPRRYEMSTVELSLRCEAASSPT